MYATSTWVALNCESLITVYQLFELSLSTSIFQSVNIQPTCEAMFLIFLLLTPNSWSSSDINCVIFHNSMIINFMDNSLHIHIVVPNLEHIRFYFISMHQSSTNCILLYKKDHHLHVSCATTKLSLTYWYSSKKMFSM